jgi:signal transduction histidine kinase
MSRRTEPFPDDGKTLQGPEEKDSASTLRSKAVLAAIALSAERMIKAIDLDHSTEEFLTRLGQAAQSDRVYVFENHSDAKGNLLSALRYKWVSPTDQTGAGRPELWQFLHMNVGLQRWVDLLGADQVIYGSVRDFPANERRLLETQDILSILIAPIMVGGGWWGFISFDNLDEEREWVRSEVNAVRTACSIIGAALENAELHRELRRRAQQLTALRDVTQTLGDTLDQDAVVKAALQSVSALCNASRAAAFLADVSKGIAVRHAVVGSAESASDGAFQVGLKTSVTGQVIITGRPVFIERGSAEKPGQDLHRPSAFLPDGVQLELASNAAEGNALAGPARAAAFVPLAVGEHVLGSLNLAFDKPHKFEEDEKRLLLAVGRQAGVALANARLFQDTVAAEREARRRADQLAVLHESTRIINASLDLDQTFDLLLEQLDNLVPYDSAAVFLHKDGQLQAAAGRGFPDLDAILKLSVRTSANSLLKEVVESQKPLVLMDAQQDERFVSWGSTEYVRGWIGVPLFSGDDLVGVLTIDSRHPGAFDQESAGLAHALADQTAVAIYKARLLDDLQRANRELRQLDVLKGQFIQNVAHELRTPVTLVRGYMELLAQGNLDSETESEAINTALNHTGTLVQLVEAITTLQDLSLGELTLESLDPSDLADTAVQLAHQKAIRAGIRLQTDIQTDRAKIPGDFIWLSHALYQLLDNAIKFSPDGGNVTLRMSEDPEGYGFQISVEDQGIGVPTEQQEQIFDLFYQADGTTTRRFGGTGLGLAIVRHVVQAHHGRVWVESPLRQEDAKHGPGSRFVIYLPQVETTHKTA